MSFSVLWSDDISGGLADWINIASLAIEALAVALIVVGVFAGSARFLYFLLWKRTATDTNYTEYKQGVARWMLLGLEILVAADVIRTVALSATLENVATLGLLVLVRTFLSWSLAVEIEGRWPWQQRGHSDNEQVG